MSSCEVCEVQKQNSPELVLFENDDWVTVLRDDDQEYLGKSVVSLKHHVGTLSDLDSSKWMTLAQSVTSLEKSIAKAFSPTHYNWQCLMNNGAATGVTHVHWHCTPRYNKVRVIGNTEFFDSRWPKTCRTVSPKTELEKHVLLQIAKSIRG